MTRPSTLRAARPMVWISEVSRAQEAFLVRVEDRNQRAFRNVETFAQQIDADQRVERAQPQIADDLDALDRVDVGMHVAHANALLVQILRQIFRHPLGQHGDERAIAGLCGGAHFADQVVDLRAGRANVHGRIDQPRRTDHLLDEHPAGLVELPRRTASPTPRPIAGASCPIPRNAAGGCPCRTASGNRIRRASPCGGSRL